MKNVTVSLDDETWREARVVAAERGTTVSALVREFLQSLSGRRGPASQRAAALFDVLDRAGPYRAAGRMSREQSHARRRVR
jgi:plasmid stability protein